MRGSEMIERRIEINEAVFKGFKKFFYWLAMMPVASDSYINGYATGIIAAFQVLGLFDFIEGERRSRDKPGQYP